MASAADASVLGQKRPWRNAFTDLRVTGSNIGPFRHLIVVIDGANPSFDYYIGSRLEKQPDLPTTLLDLSDDPASLDPSLFDAALVLFCRYLSARWLTFVRR